MWLALDSKRPWQESLACGRISRLVRKSVCFRNLYNSVQITITFLASKGDSFSDSANLHVPDDAQLKKVETLL